MGREIKAAYWRLARERHPDVAGVPAAGDFIRLHDAYTTLSDPDRRACYNRDVVALFDQQLLPSKAVPHLGCSAIKSNPLGLFQASRGEETPRRGGVAPLPQPPPTAFPSYSRLIGGKKAGGGQHDRRLSASALRPAPLVHIIIDCAGRRSADVADPSLLVPLDADAKEVERRLTETGLQYETGKCPPSSPFAAVPPPPLPLVGRWKERPSSHRLSTYSSRRLVSSSSSDDEYNEDPRNLFSSRNFSSLYLRTTISVRL